MTEKELARGAARRLAIIRHAQEVTGNVSLTCRYFGITRQAFYIWLRRYEEHGLDGLRDRSRRPRTSPNATKPEVVGKIVRERTGTAPRELRFLHTEDGLVAFLTLALDPASALSDAHAQASEVEEDIRRALPELADVSVHTEP